MATAPRRQQLGSRVDSSLTAEEAAALYGEGVGGGGSPLGTGFNIGAKLVQGFITAQTIFKERQQMEEANSTMQAHHAEVNEKFDNPIEIETAKMADMNIADAADPTAFSDEEVEAQGKTIYALTEAKSAYLIDKGAEGSSQMGNPFLQQAWGNVTAQGNQINARLNILYDREQAKQFHDDKMAAEEARTDVMGEQAAAQTESVGVARDRLDFDKESFEAQKLVEARNYLQQQGVDTWTLIEGGLSPESAILITGAPIEQAQGMQETWLSNKSEIDASIRTLEQERDKNSEEGTELYNSYTPLIEELHRKKGESLDPKMLLRRNKQLAASAKGTAQGAIHWLQHSELGHTAGATNPLQIFADILKGTKQAVGVVHAVRNRKRWADEDESE